MINGKLHLAIVIGSLCLLSGMNSYGEERNLRALMHWEGEGTMHTVGKDQILFQGVMDGVLYVETEKGALDGAFVTCPVSQKVDVNTDEAVTSGSCEITVSSDYTTQCSVACATVKQRVSDGRRKTEPKAGSDPGRGHGSVSSRGLRRCQHGPHR